MQLSPSMAFIPTPGGNVAIDQQMAKVLEGRIEQLSRRGDADRIVSQAVEGAWQQYAQSRRLDSATTTQGFHQLRQLEHVFADVLREQYAPNNAMRLFTLDTSVSPGAQYHTLTRIYRTGEVQEISGAAGEQITARVNTQQEQERAGIVHYITSVVYSIFEQMSDGFAGGNGAMVSKMREDILAAQDALMDHLNYRTWFGSVASGLRGVLTYPWMAKVALSTVFSDATSADDLKDAIISVLDLPHELSKTVYQPNTLVVSPRIRNLLYRKRLSNTDITVGKFITENNARGIKVIEEAHELQGNGPGGTDGILAYRKDRLGIMNVISNPFSRLPVQPVGISFYNYFYMSHGGVRMPNVASNLLAWAEVA